MKIVDVIGLVFLGAILIGAAYAAGHAAGRQQARFDAEWKCAHDDGGTHAVARPDGGTWWQP